MTSAKAASVNMMAPMNAVPLGKSANASKSSFFGKAAETFSSVSNSINQEINNLVGGENQYAELAGTSMRMSLYSSKRSAAP